MATKNPAGVGQAINLAAADARETGNLYDINYLYERFVFWEYFCEMIQGSDAQMIQEVINSKDFDAGMTLLKKAFEEKKTK